MNKYYLRWFIISLAIILLDQWTKQLILGHLTLGQNQAILPFFSLTLRFNSGAAFSFLQNAGGWQHYFFSAIALIASIIIATLIYRQPQKKLFCLSLSFILGGALGNLIDRFQRGEVVDFLLFYYQNHYFPAFNLADSAITLGAALFFIDSLLESKNKS